MMFYHDITWVHFRALEGEELVIKAAVVAVETRSMTAEYTTDFEMRIPAAHVSRADELLSNRAAEIFAEFVEGAKTTPPKSDWQKWWELNDLARPRTSTFKGLVDARP